MLLGMVMEAGKCLISISMQQRRQQNPEMRYLLRPEFTVNMWIYANFQGKNPNEEKVEINVRRNCFMPSKTGVGYITFAGFRVDKAATTWAPPAAYQDG